MVGESLKCKDGCEKFPVLGFMTFQAKFNHSQEEYGGNNVPSQNGQNKTHLEGHLFYVPVELLAKEILRQGKWADGSYTRAQVVRPSDGAANGWWVQIEIELETRTINDCVPVGVMDDTLALNLTSALPSENSIQHAGNSTSLDSASCIGLLSPKSTVCPETEFATRESRKLHQDFAPLTATMLGQTPHVQTKGACEPVQGAKLRPHMGRKRRRVRSSLDPRASMETARPAGLGTLPMNQETCPDRQMLCSPPATHCKDTLLDTKVKDEDNRGQILPELDVHSESAMDSNSLPPFSPSLQMLEPLFDQFPSLPSTSANDSPYCSPRALNCLSSSDILPRQDNEVLGNSVGSHSSHLQSISPLLEHLHSQSTFTDDDCGDVSGSSLLDSLQNSLVDSPFCPQIEGADTVLMEQSAASVLDLGPSPNNNNAEALRKEIPRHKPIPQRNISSNGISSAMNSSWNLNSQRISSNPLPQERYFSAFSTPRTKSSKHISATNGNSLNNNSGALAMRDELRLRKAALKEDTVPKIEDRKCERNGCMHRALFGFEPTEPRFCKDHKLIGMVNVVSDRCAQAGCDRVANYSSVTEAGAVYCHFHKLPNMLSKQNRCQADGCLKPRYYGFPNERCVFCRRHMVSGMINLRKKKPCKFEGCSKCPSYGYPGGKARFCTEHQLPQMINVFLKKCTFVGCTKTASFAYPGNKALFCKQHKQSEMINVNRAKKPQPQQADQNMPHQKMSYLNHRVDSIPCGVPGERASTAVAFPMIENRESSRPNQLFSI